LRSSQAAARLPRNADVVAPGAPLQLVQSLLPLDGVLGSEGDVDDLRRVAFVVNEVQHCPLWVWPKVLPPPRKKTWRWSGFSDSSGMTLRASLPRQVVVSSVQSMTGHHIPASI